MYTLSINLIEYNSNFTTTNDVRIIATEINQEIDFITLHLHYISLHHHSYLLSLVVSFLQMLKDDSFHCLQVWEALVYLYLAYNLKLSLQNSFEITKLLRDNIVSQSFRYDINAKEIKDIKMKMKQQKINRNKQLLNEIYSSVSEEKRKILKISNEKGASLWLTTLPLKDEGFHLDKQSFWDLLKIRYGHQLHHLPESCACGTPFNLQHALSCKKGGFITQRHNILRDTTVHLLTEVCKEVVVEPQLHPLSGESLEEKTANRSPEARLDVSARGFWIAGQKAFLDIRVFNPIAGRYANMEISKMYITNEKEKKKSYNERILNIEHGSFTPLVFNAMGGMGRESHHFYKRLIELLADKRKQSCLHMGQWVRRKVSFALMKAIVFCVRGSRKTWYDQHDKFIASLENNASDAEAISKIYY